jgi:hypothetical protein
MPRALPLRWELSSDSTASPLRRYEKSRPATSSHRRFQECVAAGVFHEIWRQGLLAYDETVGIDWSLLAVDGAMIKAPLGGAKTGPNPTDRAKRGPSVRSSRRPRGSRSDSRTMARTAMT